MRVIVQRVKYASCTVDDKLISKIADGFLLLVGFTHNDDESIVDLLVKKTLGMRIFSDADGKINRSLNDINGEILAISQFTLYADCKKGNRPSFTEAMSYDKAQVFYDSFCDKLSASGIKVLKGIFGADMKIESLNDGPATIILDSRDL